MFFHIADQHQENYPGHWQLGGFCVSTDPGWSMTIRGNATILYKGYVDSVPIETVLDKIVEQHDPWLFGNFCAIVLHHEHLHIKSDRYRSFPIYVNPTHINNLIPSEHVAWTDSLLTVHSDWRIQEDKFDLSVSNNLDTSTVDQIDHLLVNKISAFLANNTLPLRVFLSGGVDTLLLYSYIRRLGAEHQLIWNSHTDLDNFYLANSGDIQKYWGYRQIHHWQESCVLASGAPGDEFMLRSPTTANQYLLNHGTSILEQLTYRPDCLHRDYFLKYADLFASQTAGDVAELCNTVVNDWQHWHLGHTLTWTPFRDLELFKLCLSLPFELAQGQIMDSTVSRELIERNVPGLTQVLSDQKNTGNIMKNLRVLLNQQC